MQRELLCLLCLVGNLVNENVHVNCDTNNDSVEFLGKKLKLLISAFLKQYFTQLYKV